MTNKHVFVNSTCLTNVFGMFSSQLCIDGRMLVRIPSKNELEKPKSHSSAISKKAFLNGTQRELDAYLERFAKVYFTEGKVENSTVLIMRKSCFLLTCRKITFPYKGHCYCWVNAQKFRSPDSLTYGRRDKTRVFILFSKVLRNNCIDRYSLQHAQRRPHHLNNWNTSDVFLQRRELETICLRVTKVCRTETTVINGI